VRVIFLRLLAAVYVSAFSVAYFQNRVLLGDDCILPARYSLDQAEERGEANSTRRREWLSSRASPSPAPSREANMIPRIPP
jgi:hypothetical protein